MNFRFAWKYICYRLFAHHRNGHGIHSPFVFELLINVIEKDEKQFYIFQEIENIRSQLLKSNQKIVVNDFGAGSLRMPNKERKIRDIVRLAAKNQKYGQLLFRLVNHFQPKTILELGTSLGFGTMYLASANTNAKVFTIEGCNNLARYAMHNFSLLNLKNIISINETFEVALPKILNKTEKLDFVFYDGNHRKEPTLDYFRQCLNKVHNDTVFVFDDIHWSEEMEEAWEEIKKNKNVIVTIDLFFLGLVFFRSEMSKQDFVIKY